MRKTTSLALALVLLLAAAAVAPSGAADKCDALKKAMEDAWTKNLAADAAWQKTVDALIVRLERQEAVERAYAEAVKAAKQASEDWKAAVKRARACLAKLPEPKCKTEIQAARDAVDRLVKAEKAPDKWALEMFAAQMDVDEAKKAMSAALKAAKAAREEFDKAQVAYYQCLRGVKMA